jgi:hypothetical protein
MALPRRYLSFFSIFFLSAISLFAVPGAGGIQKQAGTSVKAVWMKGYADTKRELYLGVGKQTPVAITPGNANRGRQVFFNVGASTTVQLLTRKPAAVAGGAPTWAPVADIAWPAGSPAEVLLVLAAQPGGERVRAVAFADDAKSFPPGTARLANFTGTSLMARVGKDVRKLDPGLSPLFPYPVLADPKVKTVPNFPLVLGVGEEVFFNGRIDAVAGSRTLIVLAPSPIEGRTPLVQSLLDVPPVPSK